MIGFRTGLPYSDSTAGDWTFAGKKQAPEMNTLRRLTRQCLALTLLTIAMGPGSVPAAETRPLKPVDPFGPRKIAAGKDPFGVLPGNESVDVYTLTNDRGLQARIMTYGATLIAVEAPDRDGKLANITLNLDTFDEYLKGHPLMGSTVGRYANRIDNGGFKINGKKHTLKTVGKNGVHIHGGKEGFQKLNWKAHPTLGGDFAQVEFTHTSPDGHEGFPGELKVSVIYRLTNDNELFIEYEATTTKHTHLNLANHAYWNLSGAGAGAALHHELTLNADRYLAIDSRKIPTGSYTHVDGTPFDFRTPHTIGERIAQVKGGGYDHCYVLNSGGIDMKGPPAARVVDPKSGRVMEVFTTQPGVQLYTANYLTPRYKSKEGAYGKHHAICLETQHYPDSPNKPQFPSTLLRPGQIHREVTVHRFLVMK